MSIALNIFDIARERASLEKADRVVEIEMDIGTLAGIEFTALEFALENCTKESPFTDTEFVINKIKAKAICRDCWDEFEIINLYDGCPLCQSYDLEILAGRELKIKSILIE
jgi:hydrogenase nickel incorporation protein HypA/HybF